MTNKKPLHCCKGCVLSDVLFFFSILCIMSLAPSENCCMIYADYGVSFDGEYKKVNK